jgi:3-(methylthio)propionyl---CoA ligase
MSQYPKSPLMGQMMSQPLLISSIIQHADRYYGRVIASKLILFQ